MLRARCEPFLGAIQAALNVFDKVQSAHFAHPADVDMGAPVSRSRCANHVSRVHRLIGLANCLYVIHGDEFANEFTHISGTGARVGAR